MENIVYMSSQYLPCLDFLVSSVQFSVNNKVTTTQFLVFDAPSKLDNAKLSGQRLPITLRLRSRSWDVFADDLRANHLRLAARFLGRSAPDARPKIVNRSSS